MNDFVCEQCMKKGGADEVSDVIGCLFWSVPLNYTYLAQNLLGHSGKNDMKHYQPFNHVWKSDIKILIKSLVKF